MPGNDQSDELDDRDHAPQVTDNEDANTQLQTTTFNARKGPMASYKNALVWCTAMRIVRSRVLVTRTNKSQ